MTRDLQAIVVRGALVVATITGTIGGVALADEPIVKRTVQVSGTGTDLLNGTIVHSKKPTTTGVIQRGTEIVELRGDLNGKILYHVTTVIDNQKGTLVNTGDQVFSGTIAGSEPVMIHDSKFRFEVNLATGADSGSTGAIPLHRDLIRTPNGYVVNPSEAHKYELKGVGPQLR